MFLPSGSMCNQMAISTHCGSGDEVLAHTDAYILNPEAGRTMAIAGVMIRRLDGRAECLMRRLRPKAVMRRPAGPDRVPRLAQACRSFSSFG